MHITLLYDIRKCRAVAGPTFTLRDRLDMNQEHSTIHITRSSCSPITHDEPGLHKASILELIMAHMLNLSRVMNSQRGSMCRIGLHPLRNTTQAPLTLCR